MGRGQLEPEVVDWYLNLSETEQSRVRFHVDRLADLGPLLDEPYTRQLQGKLRELRFYLRTEQTRITYWIAPGRLVILLTVFTKTRRQERQVERAVRALQRCMTEHLGADTDD